MNVKDAREKILAAIKEAGEISPQQVNYKTTVPFVQIYSIAKNLETEKLVEIIQKENTKVYRLLQPGKSEVSTAGKKTEETKTDKKKKALPVKTGSRDLSRYTLNGEGDFNKSRLALAIVEKYCIEKKPSLKALLTVFPQDLILPYGVIQPIAEAKKISKNRARFFLKDSELIRLKDNVNIAVSNQWTSERIQKVIVIAKTLGYKIK